MGFDSPDGQLEFLGDRAVSQAASREPSHFPLPGREMRRHRTGASHRRSGNRIGWIQ